MSHRPKRFFRWNSAIHYPNPVGLAVLIFNGFQKIGQGGFVTGVSRHHLIGQWKTVRCDNQRNNNLHTIRTFVATVTEPALSLIRRIAFEIGACKVIKKHIKMDIKKCFPAFGQIGEEVLFMRKKFVQASVQFVLLDHSGIFAKQISNATVVIPMTMQTPLAARGNQPITDKNFQHIEPSGFFPAFRKSGCPEAVQIKKVP